MSRLLAFITLFCLSSVTWCQSLVVSTQPIYLIAKAVTQDIETPTLLLENQSGHDVTLTPEHRKLIQQAELVIWLGKAHEAPLEKTLSQKINAVALLNAGILTTLPQRSIKGQPLKNTTDTHVWLEPNNAVRIAFFIAALRSQQHPENKDAYWTNARKFAQKMLAVAQKYSSPQAKPYWSYHDAYQYLERALNLKFAGALTDEPHIAPTLAQIKYMNDNRPFAQMCLLAEAHTSPSQYQKLNPLVFESVDESLGGAGDFIKAWQNLADKTQKCVLNVRK